MPNILATPPRQAEPNQIRVATAAASSAVLMLMFGLLATWLKFRDDAPLRASTNGTKMLRDWLPADIKVPEVAANTMLVTLVMACVIAQWAAYAARRNDSAHASLALGIVAMLGVAAINAQVAVYLQMELVLRDGAYQTMFYTVTGSMLALLASGVVYSVVALFRSLAGRVSDYHVMSAHAMYWYVLTAAFTAMWFVVYVQK